MNPGVPIDAASANIHGFTDARRRRQTHLRHYAKVILERLRDDDAVFVCHNTIDAHVLRREIAPPQPNATVRRDRLRRAADLPLPVLDTQRLATRRGLPRHRRDRPDQPGHPVRR